MTKQMLPDFFSLTDLCISQNRFCFWFTYDFSFLKSSLMTHESMKYNTLTHVTCTHTHTHTHTTQRNNSDCLWGTGRHHTNHFQQGSCKTTPTFSLPNTLRTERMRQKLTLSASVAVTCRMLVNTVRFSLISSLYTSGLNTGMLGLRATYTVASTCASLTGMPLSRVRTWIWKERKADTMGYLFIYWRLTAQSTAQGHLRAFQ